MKTKLIKENSGVYWSRIKKDGLLFSVKGAPDFTQAQNSFEIIISWYGMMGLAKLLRGGEPFTDILGNYRRDFLFEDNKLTQSYYDNSAKKEVITEDFLFPNVVDAILQSFNEIYKKHYYEIEVKRKKSRGISISEGMKRSKKAKNK